MVLQSNEPKIPLFNFNGGLFVVLDVYVLKFWINCDTFSVHKTFGVISLFLLYHGDLC